MKRAIAVCILAFAALAYGQDAKVVQLSSEDAAQAKFLHQATIDAQKIEAEFVVFVRNKYLQEPPLPKGAFGFTISSSRDSCSFHALFGWGCGEFTYSEDFRFIVPKTEKPIQSCPGVEIFTQPVDGWDIR